MDINYGVIAGMLLFGIFARLILLQKISAHTSTIIFVVGYVIIFPLLIALMFGTTAQLLSIQFVAGAILQAITAYVLYRILEAADGDDVISVLGVCIGGVVLLFFMIPYLLKQLPLGS